MLNNSHGLREQLYCTYISTQLYCQILIVGSDFSFEMMPSGEIYRHDINLLLSFSLFT